MRPERPDRGSGEIAGRRTRHRGLDGLRGLAIAFVMGFHAFGAPREGRLGVDLFFVLSGFLITSLLVGEMRLTGRVSVRAFYARRARRLFPALFAMLVAVTPTLVYRSGFARGLLWAAAGLGFVANLVMSHVDSFAAPLTPLWSLAQEEQFYLVWPLILVLLASRRRVLVILLTIGLAATAWRQIELVRDGAATSRILYAPDTQSMGILVGCLLALALDSRFAGELKRLSMWLSWPALAIVVSLPFVARDREVFLGGLLVFAISSAVVIVRALDARSSIARMFGVDPLVGLGRISYSLYLWHLPVLLLIGHSHGARGELLGVVVATALAAASYRYIEQPFLRQRERRHTQALRTLPARLAV